MRNVAFALPIVLLFCLFAVFVRLGSPAWFLMPSALAAEGTDSFDALSRGYSYLYQQPLAFALWQGLALAISSLPSVVPLGPVVTDILAHLQQH